MTGTPARPRFGLYQHAVHRPDHDPTAQLEDGLALAEHADRLGLHEVWWGEHRRTSWRLVADPALMVARAAAVTHRVRLGAVLTIAGRHPAVLADTALQLDHLTRGRLLLGLSADPVPADAAAAGQTVPEVQLQVREGIEAVSALLHERAPVSIAARHAPWRLHAARPQLRPYGQDLDVRVVALGAGPGPELAGRFGHGLLATGSAAATAADEHAADTWQRAVAAAARHGTAAAHDRWAAVGLVHVAPSEAEARRQVRHGIRRWAAHAGSALPAGLTPDADADTLVDALHAGGHGVVGTPAMAVDHVARVLDRSGGVGTFLIEHAGWADPEDAHASLALFARAVVPHLTGAARGVLSDRARETRARRRAAAPSRLLTTTPTPPRGITRVHRDPVRPAGEPSRRRGRHALDPSAD